jgi:Kef-type K+ transport system membrane component KefB
MHSSVHATENLLFTVLLQLIVMIAAARMGNRVLKHLGQPGVIGEIIAGLVLGPSLLGHFLPAMSLYVFGATTPAPVTILSQIGLVLLMFQIGSDFEFGHLTRARNRNAVIGVAAASICVPLALGFGIGQLSAAALAPHMNPLVYSLFCAVGLAITAVPVLGRILREFDMTGTELGVVAISAAAANDVSGWLCLAALSAFAASAFQPATIGLQAAGIAGLFLAAFLLVRPVVNRLLKAYPVGSDGELPPNLITIVVCVTFVMGICTYFLGIFTIFGGFLTGLLFHHDKVFVEAWRRQVGRFVMVFFLPIFFALTGLRTNILGLSSMSDWEWLGAIMAAAILGKMIPVYLAGRMSGFNHDESAILGTLMNTRALMELIVLNIGYDMGFIPQNVFTMLVIMAVVTTLMTGPLLRLLLPRVGHAIPVGVEA